MCWLQTALRNGLIVGLEHDCSSSASQFTFLCCQMGLQTLLSKWVLLGGQLVSGVPQPENKERWVTRKANRPT